jgi:hypothetical protein
MSGNQVVFGMTEKEWAESARRWTKRFYWIFGIIALIALCYALFTRNQQIASVLVFLSGFIALYFYYVKWFVIPDRIPNWPPYSTPCPDFLTLVEPGDGQLVPGKCMDFVGVSVNGILKPTNTGSVDLNKNDPNYVFSIARKYKDTATNEIKDTSLTDICSEVRKYGLTWMSLCPDQ